MKIEEGDHVQLTATLLRVLRDVAPDIYEAVMESDRIGGKVISIDGNQVSVDMGESLRRPLSVETDGNHHLFLQLLKKADADELIDEPYEAGSAYPQPGEHESDQQFPPMMLFSQSQMPTAARSPDPSQTQRIPEEVPERVRMSQWCVVQMLNLKQYGIAQDLQRTPDHRAARPEPGSEAENWKGGDGKEFRPVKVELSAVEEQTYHSALNKIRNWIDEKPAPNHPEVVTSEQPEQSQITESLTPDPDKGDIDGSE